MPPIGFAIMLVSNAHRTIHSAQCADNALSLVV